MAAGIVTRNVSQIPARLQPIVVDWYNDEINMIVLAHNDLFTAFDTLRDSIEDVGGIDERLTTAEATLATTVTDLNTAEGAIDAIELRVPVDGITVTANPHTMEFAHPVMHVPSTVANPVIILPNPTGKVGGEIAWGSFHRDVGLPTVRVTDTSSATSDVLLFPGATFMAVIHITTGAVPVWKLYVADGGRQKTAVLYTGINITMTAEDIANHGLIKMVADSGADRTLTLPLISTVGQVSFELRATGHALGGAILVKEHATDGGSTVLNYDSATVANFLIRSDPLETRWYITQLAAYV